MRTEVSETPLYVQFGCGLSAPPSWINFDSSPTLRIQRVPIVGSVLGRRDGYPPFPDNVRYGDIVRGLPIATQSCQAVYCSHVLEHLSLDDLRVALRNTRSYLREGGLFRLVVPDLERLCREYLESSDDNAALNFMELAHLGVRQRSRGLGGVMRTWLGNSAHLWMWDYKSLSQEILDAGFSSVGRAAIGDSSDERFNDVEDPGRWEGCLGLEAVK